MAFHLAWLTKYAGWLPKAFAWLSERSSTGQAAGITSRVLPIDRNDAARYKCKIHVELTNKRVGAVRLNDAYFVFSQSSPLKADPKLPAEIGGRYGTNFRCPPKYEHDAKDVYLRPGEPNDVWIGIDPAHPDPHILEAISRKSLGKLFFQLTTWDEKGKPKMQSIRVEV